MIETKHSFYRNSPNLDNSIKDNWKNENSSYHMVFYCKFCHKKSFILNSDSKEIDRFTDENGRNAINIICPQCDKKTDSKDLFNVGRKEPIDRVIYNGMSFFDRDDKVRLCLRFKEINFFNNNLQQIHFSTAVVFNIATGQSYLLEPRYLSNNKKWKHYKSSGIINISTRYNSCDYNLCASFEKFEEIEELSNAIHEKLIKKLGYKIKTLKEYYEEYKIQTIEKYNIAGPKKIPTQGVLKMLQNTPIRMTHLSAYVRFPNLNPFFLNEFIGHSENTIGRQKFRKFLSKARPDTDSPISDLMSAFKVPNKKSLKKMILKDMKLLTQFYFMSLFKDVNNLRKLIEWGHSHDNNLIRLDSKSTRKFIQILIKKNKSETIVTNKIIKCKNGGVIADTARMYSSIISQIPKYQLDYTQSIQEMHDKLILDFNKLTHNNVVLKYEDHEKMLESNINGYEFRLPKDTLELVNTGSIMSICVGSYAYSVIRKSSFIVLGYKKDIPVICIELDDKCKLVRQAKTKYNELPEDKDYDAILKWMKEKNLESGTRDLMGVEAENLQRPDLRIRNHRVDEVNAAIRFEEEEDDQQLFDFQ